MDILRHLREFPITPKFSNVVDVPNFSNSFVNPVAYEFRISEFKRALIMCCTRREKSANTKRPETVNCALTVLSRRQSEIQYETLLFAFKKHLNKKLWTLNFNHMGQENLISVEAK